MVNTTEFREVTQHQTAGLDELTDAIFIGSDAPDEKNGSGTHKYVMNLDGELVGFAQFQHGPRNAEGSEPGITAQALTAVLIDHFQSFQSGPYSCRENALVITHLQEAQNWMLRRAVDRKKRGVLGVLKK